MKIKFAIPIENGRLCSHFGHCEQFAIVEAENEKVIGEQFIKPPVHQPGVYPQLLAQMGVNVILSGGMGQKAQQIFNHYNIEVCMGVPAETPTKLVEQYLNKSLVTGENLCDH